MSSQVRTIKKNYPHRSEYNDDDMSIRIDSHGNISVFHNDEFLDFIYLMGEIHTSIDICEFTKKGLKKG